MYFEQNKRKKNKVGNENCEAESLVWVRCRKNLHWTTQIRAGDGSRTHHILLGKETF